MSTGNVMGKLITPTTTSAPGIWNLQENQLAVRAGTWPVDVAPDSIPASNVLSMRTIGIPGATNSVFRDGSTNNFAVTRTGDVTQGTFSPYFPSGYWSGYFDGTGDYVSVPPNANLLFGTGDFCIEFWVNPQTTSSAVNQIWIVSPGGAERNGVAIVMRNGYMWWLVGDGSTWVFERNAGTALDLNVWSHVAVTRSGGTARFFVNGVLIDSLANTTNINQGTSWTIGGYGGTGYYLTGHMSNVRFVKGSAVYTSNFTPPTTPLTAIANTSLLCLQDNRFRDNSTNNFTISKAGDVAVARFSPFAPPRITAGATSTGSVYFNGDPTDWSNYGVPTNLSIPSSAALNPASGDFTFECWLNPNNWTNTTSGIFVTLVNTGLWIGKNGSNFVVRTAYVADLLQAALPTVKVWTHIAVVRSGTTLSLFFNGIRVATVTNSTTFVQGTSYVADDGGGSFYAGYISNLRLVKGTAVYNPTQTTLTVPTAPLTAIANTSLLTCQSASTITDASTNNFTITKNGTGVYGNVTLSANEAAPFKRVTYPYGGSGYFDGSADYLTIPDSTALQMGTGNFTYEFWWFPTSFAGYQTLFSKGGNQAGSIIMQTDTGTGKTLVASGGSYIISTTSAAATLNAWNHVALVRSETTLTVYLNGASVGSGTLSSNLNNTSVMAIGIDNLQGLYAIQGYISNFRAVKGSAVYTANFTPPSTPLTAIANTSLLVDFDNAGIYDSTGMTNLTNYGDAKTSTAVTKFSTSSVTLDGTGDYLTIPYRAGHMSFPGDFTVEAWVKWAAGLVIASTYGGPSMGWWLRRNGNNFEFGNGDTTLMTRAYTGTDWVHVAVSRASGTLRMYVGGVLQGATVSNATAITPTTPLHIGRLSAGVAQDFQGQIENLRITQAARYTADFTPPAVPFA